MKNTLQIFAAGCALVAAQGISRAQHGPILAATVPAQEAVNLYDADGANLKLKKSIAVGKNPGRLCADASGNALYVATEKGAARIDLQTLAVAGTFTDAAIKSPFGCMVSPDGGKLYLMDRDANMVFVFATGSHKLLKSITVPEDPRQGIFTPDGRSLVVSCGDAATLAVIDPESDTITRKVKTAGLDPRSMLLTPDGKYLVVALVSSDLLSWYRADSLEYMSSFGVTRSPQAVVVTSDGAWIYAGGALGDIGVVNAREHMANGTPEPRVDNSMHVGAVYSLTSTPNGDYLYAAPTDGNATVVEIRSWKLLKPPALKGAAQVLFIR